MIKHRAILAWTPRSTPICPYWRGRMVWGCGGYGEVSSNHPAAGEAICNEATYICKRCHGTGLTYHDHPHF